MVLLRDARPWIVGATAMGLIAVGALASMTPALVAVVAGLLCVTCIVIGIAVWFFHRDQVSDMGDKPQNRSRQPAGIAILNSTNTHVHDNLVVGYPQGVVVEGGEGNQIERNVSIGPQASPAVSKHWVRRFFGGVDLPAPAVIRGLAVTDCRAEGIGESVPVMRSTVESCAVESAEEHHPQ